MNITDAQLTLTAGDSFGLTHPEDDISTLAVRCTLNHVLLEAEPPAAVFHLYANDKLVNARMPWHSGDNWHIVDDDGRHWATVYVINISDDKFVSLSCRTFPPEHGRYLPGAPPWILEDGYRPHVATAEPKENIVTHPPLMIPVPGLEETLIGADGRVHYVGTWQSEDT